MTLNLGVRADDYDVGCPSQSSFPNQSALLPPVITPRTTLASRIVAPQLGVGWDVGGNSRTVIKVFGGRA